MTTLLANSKQIITFAQQNHNCEQSKHYKERAGALIAKINKKSKARFAKTALFLLYNIQNSEWLIYLLGIINGVLCAF